MAEKRLTELRYPGDFIADVRQLVLLHLRFHTYRLGWSDSAVRRYVRDAGPLLDRLNFLVRSDCATRNVFKARRLAGYSDELEERIARLEAEEELAGIRPPLDGRQVMSLLGIPPGPWSARPWPTCWSSASTTGPCPRRRAPSRPCGAGRGAGAGVPRRRLTRGPGCWGP